MSGEQDNLATIVGNYVADPKKFVEQYDIFKILKDNKSVIIKRVSHPIAPFC